jgi:hypothetical protein
MTTDLEGSAQRLQEPGGLQPLVPGASVASCGL